MSPTRRRRIVVVGHGMVAHRFVQSAIERGLTARYDLVVLGDESRPAYDRVALTSFFEVGGDALGLLPGGAYEDPRVSLRLDTTVVRIEPPEQRVRLSDGTVVGYDELVLATGAAPFVPPVPGADLPGVFVYRTIDDLESLRDAAATASVGAVVGGGLLGLEAADVLRRLGLRAHVLERSNRPLSAQLDPAAGAVLTRHLERVGLVIHTEVSTARIDGPDRVTGLTFDSGETLPVDLVVLATGVRPRDALARDAGLQVAERGGVLVDDRMRSSDLHVSAIGDCAAPAGRALGLVAPGYAMADVVVDRLLGGPAVFEAADTSARLKLLGVEVASFGDAHGATAGSIDLLYSDAVAGVHKRLVLDASGTRLLGGVLVGDTSAYGTLRAMVAGSLPLPQDLDQLLLPAPATSEPLGEPAASTVCDHFDLTEDELVDVVDASAARRFVDVLQAHGRGAGCDVCRTVVVSALVSRLTTA